MAIDVKAPFEILLVDDNAADVRMFKESFKLAKAPVKLNIATNGEEAMRFLRRLAPYEKVSLPNLVLLDLNLPKKDGRQILKEMKSDEQLKRIPVIVISSSGSPKDISDAYDLHANSYIVKPGEVEDFLNVGKAIEHYWVTTATRPA